MDPSVWKIVSTLIKHFPIKFIQEFNEKYSCNINIASTCINTRQTVIFNGEDYPDVKVFDAIVASCSIPFVFMIFKLLTLVNL